MTFLEFYHSLVAITCGVSIWGRFSICLGKRSAFFCFLSLRKDIYGLGAWRDDGVLFCLMGMRISCTFGRMW